MEASARYALVGAVILFLIAGLAGSLIWLLGPGDEGRTSYYTIYFKRQSLSGLQVDSYVTMKGIRVGSVASIQILPTDIERVKVLVKVQLGTPIKTDTAAIIQRNLLTGLANIDLVGSTQAAPLLTVIEHGEESPIIPEGETGFEKIQSSVPELLQRTNEMLEKLNGVFSDENRRALGGLIVNAEKMSSQVASGEDEFSKAAHEVSALAAELRGMLKGVDDGLRKAAMAVQALADGASRGLTSMAQDITTASQKVSAAAERLEDPKRIIFGPSKNALGPGEKTK